MNHELHVLFCCSQPIPSFLLPSFLLSVPVKGRTITIMAVTHSFKAGHNQYIKNKSPRCIYVPSFFFFLRNYSTCSLCVTSKMLIVLRLIISFHHQCQTSLGLNRLDVTIRVKDGQIAHVQVHGVAQRVLSFAANWPSWRQSRYSFICVMDSLLWSLCVSGTESYQSPWSTPSCKRYVFHMVLIWDFLDFQSFSVAQCC